MKNWDFHEEELKKYNFAFGMRNNQMDWRSKVSCSKCEFNVNGIESCSGAKLEWLYQDYKEPIVLTDDEKALCKLLGRGWIARDKNGDLYWHFANPLKTSMYWGSKTYLYYLYIQFSLNVNLILSSGKMKNRGRCK